MSVADPPSLVGCYRILEALGEGGAGRVFLVTPTEKKAFARPGELLALKVYKEEILKEPAESERIQREYKVGSTLAHPNVVTVHSRENDGRGAPFLVMEYVDGDPLSNWVPMYHRISESLLLEILCEISDGICALHDLGVIHRDLKPANIMLSGAFRAKIMDLGVVHLTADTIQKLTPSHQFLATIRNSSPELLQGNKYDDRTDLYSFGTIMYFLLHGEEVFAEHQNFAKLVDAVIHSEPAFDDKLKEESPTLGRLLEICKHLLAKSPDDRPATSTELRDLLEQERRALAGAQQPLCAYMAAALTGLSAREREGVTFVGHAIAEICKKHNIYAHQPRKATDPVLHKEIPAEAVYSLDRRRIVASDLVIGICNDPSFGVGQEFEIAGTYGTPIILVKRPDVSISRMVTGGLLNLVGDPIEYGSPEELARKVGELLGKNLDYLRRRRDSIATGADHAARLGEKLRDLRGKRQWTTEQAAYKYGICPRFLRLIENSSDGFHNVGVVVLTRIAAVHGVSLSDLLSEIPIEVSQLPSAPDGNELLIERVGTIEQWPTGDTISIRDAYRGEAAVLAARGSCVKLTPEEIRKRHEPLERKRLDDSRLF
jgi:tRNA A-37 threonylcarbamoyl transferase component Bud32/transcriptional regulator with XRE-family HTH domain